MFARVSRIASSRLAVAVLAATAALSVTSVAYAVGATTTSNVVNACAKTAAPYTLAVKKTTNCPAGTTALAWNKTGPQGPQGVRGVQGVQGPPGLAGFNTVTAATGPVPAGNLGSIDVPCPDSERAISGGYTVPYTATVLDSHPKAGDPTTWSTSAAFPSVSGVLTAYVQCAATN